MASEQYDAQGSLTADAPGGRQQEPVGEPNRENTSSRQPVPGPEENRSYQEQIRELQREVRRLEAEVADRDERINQIIEQYEDAYTNAVDEQDTHRSSPEEFPEPTEEFSGDEQELLKSLCRNTYLHARQTTIHVAAVLNTLYNNRQQYAAWAKSRLQSTRDSFSKAFGLKSEREFSDNRDRL